MSAITAQNQDTEHAGRSAWRNCPRTRKQTGRSSFCLVRLVATSFSTERPSWPSWWKSAWCLIRPACFSRSGMRWPNRQRQRCTSCTSVSARST